MWNKIWHIRYLQRLQIWKVKAKWRSSKNRSHTYTHKTLNTEVYKYESKYVSVINLFWEWCKSWLKNSQKIKKNSIFFLIKRNEATGDDFWSNILEITKYKKPYILWHCSLFRSRTELGNITGFLRLINLLNCKKLFGKNWLQKQTHDYNSFPILNIPNMFKNLLLLFLFGTLHYFCFRRSWPTTDRGLRATEFENPINHIYL